MRNFVLAAFIAVGLVVVVIVIRADQPGRQSSKPIVVETAIPTPMGYVDLDQAYALSDAVLLVRIASGAPVAGPASALVQTDYRCKVLDVLKGDETLQGTHVIVRRLGGVRDEGNVMRRVVVDAFPDFASGEEYVLLLKRSQVDAVFTVSAEGSFDVRDGVIHSTGKTHQAKAHEGQQASELIESLRRLKKR